MIFRTLTHLYVIMDEHATMNICSLQDEKSQLNAENVQLRKEQHVLQEQVQVNGNHSGLRVYLRVVSKQL